MSTRYVWRVTGEWPPFQEIEEGWPPTYTVRHYLSKRAAERRADLWRNGAEYDGGREPETGAPVVHILPPARRVTVERSAPVQWEDA